MISNGIKSVETTETFSKNAENLMAQLNTEGKELAIEYMEYLVSTGKYAAKNYRDPKRIPVINGFFTA